MNRSKRLLTVSIFLILAATFASMGACLDFSMPLDKINLAFDSEIILESSFYTYTGEEITPSVTLKHRNEVVDEDNYTLVYSDNVQPGEASIVATGKGKYYGEVSADFNIGYRYMFDTDGADKVTGEIEQSILSKDELIPPTVEKKGYDFSHWSIDSQIIDFTDKENLPNSGVFKANYILNTFKIVYHLGDGVNSADNKSEYTVEDAFALKDPSIRGVQFAGWYLDSEHTERITSLKGYAQDLDLYAKYVGYDEKKLTYITPSDANDVAFEMFLPETALSVPTEQIKEENGKTYKLVWYADSKYAVRYFFREMPNINLTVYAQWEEVLRAGFLDKVDKFSSNDFSIDSFEELVDYVDYVCFNSIVSEINGGESVDADYIDITYVTASNDIKNEIGKALTAATYPRMASVGYAYTDGKFKIALSNDVTGKEASMSSTDEKDFVKQIGNIFALTSLGREDNYNKFPIDFEEKTFEVESSNQLFYVLSHGYCPLPKKGSRAESVYNFFRSVLKDICDESMSDFDKAKAIYEWIILHVQYDNAVAYPDLSTQIGQLAADKDKTYLFDAFYLEGVIRGSAVCDGISKAYSVMCAIEGIDCVRVTGDDGLGGEHAWNKVKISGKWYLSDATWGNAPSSDKDGVKKEYLSYQYFLFTDRQRSESDGYINQNYLYYLADTEYPDGEYYSSCKVEIENYIADFYIDSDVELSYILDYIDVNFKDKILDGMSFEIMLSQNIVINGVTFDKTDLGALDKLYPSAMTLLKRRRGPLNAPVIIVSSCLPDDEEDGSFNRAVYIFKSGERAV